MKQVLILIALFALLASAGCGHNTLPDSASINNSLLLQMSYDEAFDRTLKVLAAAGYTVHKEDREQGIIITNKKLVMLSETGADCGAMLGLPYTRDSHTTSDVSFSISLKRAGQRTEILLNSQIDAIFNTRAMGGRSNFSCYSLGALEKELIHRISEDKL